MSLSSNSISIVLPAYNEETNITATIEAINKHFVSRMYDYEIIVVNDGSRDSTGDIVNTLIASYPNVKLISHVDNVGYGGALISGFNKAKKELIFFMDSDRQFNIEDFDKLITHFKNTETLVIGYRISRKDKIHRIINAKVYNLAVRILFGLKIKDIDCAFKLMPRSFVQNAKLYSNGALINTEILAKAKCAKLDVIEIPVRHFARVSGSSTGASIMVILKAMSGLLQLKMRLSGY